jgi:hypothetical protein
MNRRDFITLWIQALLLALFPWLRSERGIEIAGRAADAMAPRVERAIFKGGTMEISIGIKGYELSPEMYAFLRRANESYVSCGPAANFMPIERLRET